MSKPTIQVTIVDSAGVQRTFSAGHVALECGCGCIDIRPGKGAFCRGFDRGIITLHNGASVTALSIINGMAALFDDAVHVLCERSIALTSHHPAGLAIPADLSAHLEGSPCQGPTLSPAANAFPAK